MKIGIVGLGRMGSAIAYRLVQAGHEVIGSDPGEQSRQEARAMGVTIADSIEHVAQSVSSIWLMVPAGPVVDVVIQQMLPHIQPNTIIVDGGNSKFTDSIRRAQELAKRSLVFLDCGTSGGLNGKEQGFSLMVGGDKNAYTMLEPLLRAIAAPGGFGHVGPSGAGHYVKMVHNGIEYGLMQAYAEGFHLIKDGSYQEQHLDLQEITRIWQHGAVIRSWLLDLSHDIFAHDQTLKNVSGVVEESGMGKWTVEDAHKHHIPVTVIEESLAVRARSHATGGNYATKVVSLLRHAFGGHKVGVIKKD